MMSIFCTKALSIFLYIHVVSDKKWHKSVNGLLKPQNIFLYLYICCLYCKRLDCKLVLFLVILNLVVLNEALH